jgi:signal transduction histidine kinase
MLLQAAARSRKSRAELQQEMKRLSALAGRTLEMVRTMTHGMLPLEIRERGFRSVCESLVAAVRAAQRVRIALHFTGGGAMPQGAAGEHLFRIMQESITNAIKHGGATRIAVIFKMAPKSLTLSVADNGSGFDEQRARAGAGVQIMRYRARMLGGLIGFHSPDRGGTLVRCMVPRSAEKREDLKVKGVRLRE